MKKNNTQVTRTLGRLFSLPLGICSLACLLLFLLFASLGNFTQTSGNLFLTTGVVENEFADAGSNLILLPFNLTLLECDPHSNQAVIKVEPMQAHSFTHRLKMDSPLQMGSWTVYLSGCTASTGQKPAAVELTVIRNVWQTVTRLSILLTFLCAICLLFQGMLRERMAKADKWLFRWLFPITLLLCAFFVLFNVLKPFFHTRELQPSLQNTWFIPHVATYILSYTFLCVATILSLKMLIRPKQGQQPDCARIESIDNLVRIGTGLFLAGMLMGALWAKEAWGDFWTWDVKETWAFITASTCLAFIHLRTQKNTPNRHLLWLVVLAFLFMLITWKGVNYLPGSSKSLHTYSKSLSL